MPLERFYCDLEFGLNQQLTLIDQEFHHLVHVMRMKAGESLEVVNGRGSLAQGILQRIEKKQAVLQITEIHTAPPPTYEVILAQAIPRPNRLDFILEKGTELGMTQLWLFPAQSSERKSFTDHQLVRMEAITIAAMKQCGRLYLPKIVIKPPLSKWDKPSQLSFFGDVDPTAASLSKVWHQECQEGQASKGVVIFIGPESGFTLAEIESLRSLNATGVKLHSNILRTDTAALVALSLLTHELSKK